MRIRYVLFLLLIASLAALVAGCGGGGGSAYSAIKDGNPGSGNADWTVMVFLNADNDLEPFSITNVEQMMKVGSNSRVKIVVQWDRSPAYSIEDGNWTDTRRYEIYKGEKRLVQQMGEVDMGDPQSMKDFISWAQQNYPAQHYCLVIWNHGRGWRSISPRGMTTTRNVSFDDSSNGGAGSSISTRDLPDIMRSASQRIDLVAMDASLMQMTEVAYEMKDTAGLLVGSEESPPGDGYDYEQWLRPLTGNPSMSALTLGKTITDTYIRAYSGTSAVTESVVDLNRINEVGISLDNFASALIPYAVSHAAELRTARENAQFYSYDEYKYKDMLDYALKASQAVGSPSLASAYSQLAESVKQAVLYEAHSGTSVQNSHGLSIWIPDPAAYTIYRNEYSLLQLSRDASWDSFLGAQIQ